MQKYTKWFSGAVALSVLALGAMNITSVGSRSSGQESYDRLLSKHYKRIAALEAEIGTYSHYRHFSDKAERVIGDHNPRPIKVRGGRDIRNMRRDLERAMVGYEMRHNPDAVAGMHAAFECYAHNMNVNHRLDSRCLKAFKTFKAKAERSVDRAHMQVAHIDTVPAMQKSQPLMAPIGVGSATPKIETVSFAAPQKKETNPQNVVFTPIAPMAPIVEIKEQQEKSVISPSPVVMKDQKIETLQKVETMQPIASEMPIAKSTTISEIPQGKSFDPLDYVHPRLRHVNHDPVQEQSSLKQSEMTAPSASLPVPSVKPEVKKPASYSEGTVSKVPESLNKKDNASSESAFGIKRLSKTRMPQSTLFAPLNLERSMSKIDMSMFEESKQIEPHPRFLEQSLDNAPEYTAAIDAINPATERYVVPFIGGGTHLSKAAKMEIQRIGSKIQREKFSKIRFIGHADKGGSSEVNRSLSFERAASVHDALENIINYVEIQNTSIDGMGDSQPVRAFRPEDDRNRRVVVELVR